VRVSFGHGNGGGLRSSEGLGGRSCLRGRNSESEEREKDEARELHDCGGLVRLEFG